MRPLLGLLLLVASMSIMAKAADSSDLLEIDASWNELRLKSDVEGLDRLLADDWLLTHSDGRVQTKSDYLGELTNRARTNQEIANEDILLRTYGDTAVVTGVSVQSGTRDGEPWSGSFRFTRIWIHSESGWKMVASHSSRVTPTD